MDREELVQLKTGVEAQAVQGLELHNKALGALEVLEYLLSLLEDKNDGNGNDFNTIGAASNNGESGAGKVPVAGGQANTSPDGQPDSDPS